METHDRGGSKEAPRPAEFLDLRRLCAELNRRGARYVVVGGFAIIQHGFNRFTDHIDLLIETTPENEARVIDALLSLPDKAAAELKPGEVANYDLVRIVDDVIVGLLKGSCGITYAEAIRDVVIQCVNGVPVPFASVDTLRQMKQSNREKDIPDRLYLEQLHQS